MKYQVLILFLVYAAFIVSLGFFRPDSRRKKYLIRKTIHLATGLLIFYLTFRISRQTLLILLIAGTLFSFTTYFIKRFNYIHVTGESSLGTLFYPVGVLSSFLILYGLPIYYFQITLLFLAISDTMANLGGSLTRGNHGFAVLSERKTPMGIFTYAVTAFFIMLVLLPGPVNAHWSFIVLTVVLAIHFEIISYRGSDNLSVPLGTALFFFLSHGKVIPAWCITAVILAMGLASILLYRSGILTRSGTILAHILGIYLFGFLGLEWALPVVFFFVTSVFFTKLNSRVNRKSHGAVKRNVWQVTANIAAAILFSALYLATSLALFIYLFIAVVAAVTADTWASEIGPLFHRKCFSLSGWRTATAGVSGGISLAGTLAAFAGAVLVALLGWALFHPGPDFRVVWIIAFAGFLASFVDSLLGAFMEPRLNDMRYFRRNYAEAPSPNDIVNISASFSVPVFFLILDSMVG